MLEIEKLQLEPIIVSDIHASKELFIRLLDKVVYTSEDYLFINGDLCEKGPNSLEAVRYAMELEQSSNRVFITKGNCDILFQYVLMRMKQYGTISKINPILFFMTCFILNKRS